MTEKLLKMLVVLLGVMTVTGTVLIVLMAPRPPAEFVRAAAEECRSNLRVIDEGKCIAAIKFDLTNGAVVTREQVTQCLPFDFPACPEGGEYRVNAMGRLPECSRGGAHALPPDYGKPEITSTGPARDPGR